MRHPSSRDLPGAEPRWAPAWLSQRRAWLLLALLALAIAGGLLFSAPPASGTHQASGDITDIELYQQIAARVVSGENYYTAAITEQRQHGYPTTPAMAVRLPTLTFVEAALGQVGITAVLLVLALAALVTLGARIRRSAGNRFEHIAAVVLLAANLAVLAIGPLAWFHDSWAGVLILLAIGLGSQRRWWPSLLAGFAAVCFREMALPFLLVMAAVHWHRNRRQAVAWLGATAAFAVIYGWHIVLVQSAQMGASVVSQGWLDFGGWQFVLAATKTGSLLFILPTAVAAVAVPLALFGWVFVRDLAAPVLATCLVFMVGFLLIGRVENSYWGLLYASLLLTGLAFAPRGLALAISAASGSRTPPSASG
jgi:hypothetical protein